MKKLLAVLAVIGAVLSAPQAASANEAIGYMSTSCGSAPSPCFIQYGPNIPVTATLSGTSTVRITGNAGATLDSTIGPASAPTNALAVSGEYLSNANQPAATTGQSLGLQTTPDGAIRTAPQRPATGDILDGLQSFTATTAATTIITVPSGRTWVGTVSVSAACDEVAAATAECKARAVISTAGTNVTPAAGNYFACDARGAANASTGTVGSQGNKACATPFTVTAPAGNSVTVQVTTTQAGTNSQIDASAIGNLQ